MECGAAAEESKMEEVSDRCFLAFFGLFRAPPGCPRVERQFFGALDGEEFFVVEGPHAN